MNFDEIIGFIKNDKKSSIIIGIFIILVYLLNINHINQQAIFFNKFLSGAEYLLNNGVFSFSSSSGKPVFYPMWGYSVLLIPDVIFHTGGAIAMFISAVLVFLALISLFLTAEKKPNYISIALLLPIIATASAKWPEAIVISLVIFYVYFFKKYLETGASKHLIYAVLVFAIQLNFRTELMYLPFFPLPFLLFLRKRNELMKRTLKFSILVGIFGILALTPWAYRYYSYNGKFSLATSNSGMVAMIGLGHLSDNPWGIKLSDSYITEYCKAKGYDNPEDPATDEFLKKEFINIIKNNPGLFIKKCLINSLNIIKGGVYTGEYANLTISPDRRNQINEELKKTGGQLSQLIYLKNYSLKESLPILVEKAIQFIFIILFFVGLFVYSLKIFRNPKNEKLLTLAILTAPIIIYKFILTAALIYEPRFMNLSAGLLLPVIWYVDKNR